MTTRGDQILDRPLSKVGGKGLFVKELEAALLDGAADPSDGHNVVIHEFAHRLDQDHGPANGAPWLGPRRGYAQWARVLGAEYASWRARVEAGVEGLIPAYGAIDPAEFYAVVSELYFERPIELRAAHPALYAQLQQVYRTDPSAWH